DKLACVKRGILSNIVAQLCEFSFSARRPLQLHQLRSPSKRCFTSAWGTPLPSSSSLRPSSIFCLTYSSYIRSSQLADSGNCSISSRAACLAVCMITSSGCLLNNGVQHRHDKTLFRLGEFADLVQLLLQFR